MGDVIGLSKPNSALIETLEGLLREAKAGTISSIAAVVIRNGDADFAIEVPDLTTLEMIGALETLKLELLSDD